MASIQLDLLCFSFQRLASDFLSKYIFITVGRVGSSTDLITQQVEFVTHDEKRTYLIDLLQKQSFTSSDGKVEFAAILDVTIRFAPYLFCKTCSHARFLICIASAASNIGFCGDKTRS